jgi:outer membrane protein assembly factor BamB
LLDVQALNGGRRFLTKRRAIALLLQLAILASAAFLAAAPALLASRTAAAATTADWPTFLHDPARSAATTDNGLTAANAGQLRQLFAAKLGGPIAASPAIVNGTAYVGSWDGYEYAINAGTGAVAWKTNLGLTNDPPCHPPTLGVTSSAAVINGVVYVGGGDSFWYALNASNGAVLWKVFTGDNTQAGAHYNWSSPLISGNFAYIGIASNCDAPLVQGQLLKVDLTTHQVVGTANMVNNGEVGGGIWTSPTLDAATNTIFVTTGTINLFSQKNAQAIVAINATNMTIRDAYQVPFAEAVSDSDWGNTPTLTVDSNGRKLVSASNKNGILYTFDRANLAQGPVWKSQIAYGGDCPTCGDGSISSAAFANGTLYQAAGSTTINGEGHKGSVRAFNPGTGTVLWQHPTEEAVLGSIAWSNGLLVVPQLGTLEVLDAATGNSLWTWKLTTQVYAAPVVYNGRVYVGALDGNLYAFSPVAAIVPPPDPNCPVNFTCQDVGKPGVAGSELTNADGSITFKASGPGARGVADEMRIATTPVTGDFQVKLDLLSATGGAINGYQAPQVGIMIRETNDPGSPYYTDLSDPTYPAENQTQPNFIAFFRDRFNVQTTELTQNYPTPYPRWVMIQRHGDEFRTLDSADGTNWTLIGGTIHRVVMRSTLMVGYGISAGTHTAVETATFKGLQIGPITQNTFKNQPTSHACPSAWSCLDVGAGSPIGDQQLNNGTWTISGTSSGIAGSSDSFHFVYQKMPGDGTITGRLTSLGNSNAAAQAALVMRKDTTQGSPFYGIVNTVSNGAEVVWREHANLDVTRLPIPITVTMPEYLQIARYTDTAHGPTQVYYSALTSTDGTNWNQVPGSTIALDLGANPVAGMGGSSLVNRGSNPSTWTNVAVSGTRIRPPGICPDNFTCQDIGTGFAPSSQLYNPNNGQWNVDAGGTDMWDVYDQFHLASQPMPGDGSVSARVVSIGTTAGEWAKEGVMLRSSNDPQAPYYGVFVTKQHGVQAQWRTAQGAITNAVTGPASAAPLFVLAARWTDTRAGGLTYYTGYTSTDGQNWTVIPNSTVPLNMPGTLLSGIANDSYDQAKTAAIVMDSVTQYPSAPKPPGVCPSAWQCDDIGGAAPPGTQDVDANGVWTANVGGGDIWDVSDQFHLISQPLNGDGKLSARLVSATNAGPWAKDGVMLRGGTDPGAPYYGIFVTPANGSVIQYRATQGAATQQISLAGAAPMYLQVSRFTDSGGTQFLAAATSPDGVTWTTVPNSTVNMTLPAQVLAGLAGDSYNQGVAATITWDHVVLSTTVTPPPGACPTGYSCSDVGGAQPPGTQSLNGTTLTVGGGGGDIWDVSDQFRFVQQSLAGDGTVSASVANQTATDPWAKAGVMLRSSLVAGAPYYAALRSPGHGYFIQYRSTLNGTSSQRAIPGAPAYLRVARWTDTSGAQPVTWLTAYTSPDGNAWTAVPGTTISLPLTGALLAGFAVTSHSQGNLSSVDFGTPAVATGSTQPPGVCPAAYTCTDVGGAQPPGNQALSGGTWTVGGGGGDIWGTGDQFHLVSQSRATDGSVTVQLTAQGNTNAWAKAGVVARDSLATDAAYYGVFVTPGNGVVVQWRAADAAGSSNIKIAGAVPTWLRITRTGTSFTAFTSADGVTWTAVAGSTMTLAPLGGTLVEGLAVTSHDVNQVCNVTAPTFTIS